MSILIALFRTHHKIVTDFDKDNNRSSHTILKVATTSRSNRISDKSRDRRGIDEGGHHCHEAISRAYERWYPCGGIDVKVVTLAKVMTLVGGQTRSGT